VGVGKNTTKAGEPRVSPEKTIALNLRECNSSSLIESEQSQSDNPSTNCQHENKPTVNTKTKYPRVLNIHLEEEEGEEEEEKQCFGNDRHFELSLMSRWFQIRGPYLKR
jgi:hypothetical protein